MKIIYNNIIPFEGYKIVNILGLLFVRKKFKGKLDDVDINHERIHTAQMKELCYIFFYIIYIIEYFFRYWGKGNAYRNISFEKEAYENESNLNYLSTRKHFNQWR
jgi:hypothetical protein